MSNLSAEIKLPHGLTDYGEKGFAKLLLQRGMAFGYASVLLRRNGGDGYVCLHLLCQSIEIILKSLLLLLDFKHYAGKRLRKFGHRLEPLPFEVLRIYKLNPLNSELLAEL